MKNVANQRYYLVREDVLTDAMQKTLEAKQLLQKDLFHPFGMR